MSSGPSAVVVDHDERWAQDFEAIRARLWPVVAAGAIDIEHVGSTAVPGLAAEPVIDVDVVVRDAESVPRAVAALESLGYEHRGELDTGARCLLRSAGTARASPLRRRAGLPPLPGPCRPP
jgi:GrpB-like predicted nucleotidyltransferase (UPF0157 family)